MRATFGRAALRDIDQIAAYLDGENPRVAALFLREVRAVRSRIAEFPDLGTRIPDRPYRFVMLTGLPYKVFYRRASRDEVRIVRVRHGRRRPLDLS
jgi:plasmid stabilization system protein ParE